MDAIFRGCISAECGISQHDETKIARITFRVYTAVNFHDKIALRTTTDVYTFDALAPYGAIALREYCDIICSACNILEGHCQIYNAVNFYHIIIGKRLRILYSQ